MAIPALQLTHRELELILRRNQMFRRERGSTFPQPADPRK